MDPLTYVTPAEFVADPEVIDRLGHLSVTPEIPHALSMASAWCDEYVETQLAVHRHVECKRMCPDPDGRLIWFPDHGPLISLESLTFGLTTYTTPTVTVVNDRYVVVDLRATTAAWVGSLQFGIPAIETDTTWSYTAGYFTPPRGVRGAVVLYGINLIRPDSDLVVEAQSRLDPYRWTR